MKVSTLAACLLLTCYSLPLEASTPLPNNTPYSFPDTFSKPQKMKAIQWVNTLETERNKAGFYRQFDTVERITKEISATIAGKYGFSKRCATKDEALNMLGSVIKTRHIYRNKLDILNDFYFSYSPKGVKDIIKDERIARHIAIMTATDALYTGLINEKSRQKFLKEGFSQQKKDSNVNPSFVGSIRKNVLEINGKTDEETINSLFKTISSRDWKALVDRTRPVIASFIPYNQFLDGLNSLSTPHKELIRKLVEESLKECEESRSNLGLPAYKSPFINNESFLETISQLSEHLQKLLSLEEDPERFTEYCESLEFAIRAPLMQINFMHESWDDGTRSLQSRLHARRIPEMVFNTLQSVCSKVQKLKYLSKPFMTGRSVQFQNIPL